MTEQTPDTNGYIFLWRKLLDHPVWRMDVWTNRVWLWLLLHATHRGNVDHRGLRPGVLTCTLREVQLGVRYTDARGQEQEPGKNKVNRVFHWLQHESMIQYHTEQGIGVRVEIVEWQKWQNHWDNTLSSTVVAFNDDGGHDWEPDPTFQANTVMELWGRDNLPNSPHWSVQEMALHNLHHRPPHFTPDQIQLIVKTVKDNAGGALSWIWKAGPVRLGRPIKSTGQLTAEFVLHFEPRKETNKNDNAKKGGSTYGSRKSRTEQRRDATNKALGWTEQDESESATRKGLP